MAIWVRAASFGAQFTVEHWQAVPPAKAAADIPSKASALFTLFFFTTFFFSSSLSSSGSLRQGTGSAWHVISTAPSHVNAPQFFGFFFAPESHGLQWRKWRWKLSMRKGMCACEKWQCRIQTGKKERSSAVSEASLHVSIQFEPSKKVRSVWFQLYKCFV